ncbi:helix-turn-helix domain-containing protein [Flammeovirga agarivorans]|uniref:Helix-turn-helix transcriptional regulator n=1 Tax=Flammeovirga agarivorans TaxID=2726742 RepID=A0A7X8XU83_9BACT|nr:AraC family transcriptional regulator [Flammeovirga agarivorans]NLR89855.1 helix-turn-helix transcriptional regulator [Flammeovirga agarivorans]
MKLNVLLAPENSSYFNYLNNNSNYVNTKNNGVYEEEKSWDNDKVKGYYQSILLASFSINRYLVEQYMSCEDGFIVLNPNKKILVFNLSEAQVEYHVNNNMRMLRSLEGELINEQQFELRLNKLSKVDLLVIEFNDGYFEHLQLPKILSETLFSLFNKKTNFIIQKDLKIHKILLEILDNHQNNLGKFLYYSSKVVAILSEIIRLQEIEQPDHIIKSKVEFIKQLITDNIHIQYSIPDLSKEVGINESYLKKYFKKYTNETIFEFANRKRIEHAKSLLCTTKLPIGQITEQIGFQHASHFSYAFKKAIGCTPYQYRSRCL